MKLNKNRIWLFGAAALMLASCSENSWNDLYLDGFEGGSDHSQVERVDYTLTAADYAALADNSFNKSMAAEAGVSGDLAAVKSQGYLNAAIPAAEYIPNLLKDQNFRYFALSDGSAINLTYREAGELPEVMRALNGAKEYTISDEDYQSVYGSADDYAASFSPSHPAAKNIPAILKTGVDAEKGDYVIVNYNSSATDPVFNQPSTPPTPGFTMSSVINSSLCPGDDVTINGVVTAVCKAGVVVSDNTGSLLVYANGFPFEDYKVGDQVIATGTLSSYKNCLQLAYSDNLQKVGEQTYTYPTAVNLTPDYLLTAAANTEPVPAVFGTMTGTVNISGNYINIAFDGREDVRGSVYNATDEVKALLADGAKVKMHGYFTQTSNSGSITNCNFIVTKVESAAAAKRHNARRRIVAIPATACCAAYTFNGEKWEAAGSDVTVLQPADYVAMGSTYGNLSNNQPAQLLPTYLKQTFPYAQAEATKYVVYKYYASGSTTYACAQYAFNGSTWEDSITTNGVRTVTNQFVRRNGVWQLDPSVEFTLPAGKGQPLSTEFYQACVDWVKANVEGGADYVTSYGNNDYYTGASAYQGNIDLRAASAVSQNPAAYAGMSDEEIVALMKHRFEMEVCPAVLAQFYPNMAPIGDFQPTVTIHFYTYNGSSTQPQTIVYKTVAKGKFEFVSCTWND